LVDELMEREVLIYAFVASRYQILSFDEIVLGKN
jgi:hypothetical protein